MIFYYKKYISLNKLSYIDIEIEQVQRLNFMTLNNVYTFYRLIKNKVMDSQYIDNLKKAGEEFVNKYYHDWYHDPVSLIE